MSDQPKRDIQAKRKEMTLPELLLMGATPRMLLFSIASVIGGTAAATLRGNLEILPATLCLLFAVLAQISGTYWHFYNEIRIHHIPERTVDSNLIPLSSTTILREAATSFFFLAAMVGLPLMVIAGWWSLIIVVALFAIVYFTYGTKHPLAQKPLGLVSTFLIFGFITVIGTCLVQSAQEAREILRFYDIEPALYIGAIMGLMAVNSNLVINIDQLEADKKSHRKTLPMVIGLRATQTLMVINGLIWTALTVWLGCIQHFYDWWFLIVPVLVFVINWWITAKTTDFSLSKKTIQLTVNLNMLAMAVYMMVIASIFGAADDSARYIF